MTEPVFGLVIGATFFHERLRLLQGAGTTIILGAVAVLLMQAARGKAAGPAGQERLGWLLGLTAGLGFALSAAFRKLGLKALPLPATGTLIVSASSVLIFTAILAWRGRLKGIFGRARRNWAGARFFALSGAFLACASLLLSWAVVLADVSVVSTLAPAAIPAFTLVLTKWWLRGQEQLSPLIIGTALALSVGVLAVLASR